MTQFKVPHITIDPSGCSIFTETCYEKEFLSGRFLSPQIETINLRLRESEKGYSSTWHVAGDPTMILILQGCMRIYLQNGEQRDFSKGDVYIAADYTPEGTTFDEKRHGHRAELIGDEDLKAVHIKLPDSARI